MGPNINLDERAKQLSALVNVAVDGILSIDARGSIRLCNPAVEKMFGWTQDELIGEKVNVLMPARYAEKHDGFLSRYLDQGEAQIIGIGRKVEGLRKDGVEFPMHLSVGEFELDGENYFVGIVRDLTAEFAERSRIRELEGQLSLLGRHSAVTEMGASLAHELNQPLTAIDLFLTAAKRSFENDPQKAISLFDDACAEAQRAGQIVRRIRKMVERSDQEHEHFSLKPLIEDAVKLCQMSDQFGPVRISLTGASNIQVYGDEVQIRQILVNLIQNAFEATANQEKRELTIQMKAHGFVDIEVSDNGPGIAEPMLPLLFEPFQSSKPKGLGIGLSICRTIAENHGGELTHIAKSRDADGSVGACFRLRLPLISDEGRDEE